MYTIWLTGNYITIKNGPNWYNHLNFRSYSKKIFHIGWGSIWDRSFCTAKILTITGQFLDRSIDGYEILRMSHSFWLRIQPFRYFSQKKIWSIKLRDLSDSLVLRMIFTREFSEVLLLWDYFYSEYIGDLGSERFFRARPSYSERLVEDPCY